MKRVLFSMNTEISQNVLKSQTSIVGIVCKDGVVVAADKRATAGGQIVMKKKEDKIRMVSPFILTACTGTASDIDLSNKVLAAELRLKELRTKTRATVEEAANLLANMTYRNIRTPMMIPNIVGSLIAGVDEDGKTSVFSIEPAGGVSTVDDYDANFSSGMPYILGLLEHEYKKDMSMKEGIELAKGCIKAAIERDPASGNGLDVFAITKDGIKQVVSEEIIPQYK